MIDARHMQKSGASTQAPISGLFSESEGCTYSDVEATIQPLCPWCHGVVTETANRDGQLRGWHYAARTYRCDTCRATIRVSGDAELTDD